MQFWSENCQVLAQSLWKALNGVARLPHASNMQRAFFIWLILCGVIGIVSRQKSI